ncbi:MAG: hypothetical protein ACJ72L_21805 [Marmoricola sp.]
MTTDLLRYAVEPMDLRLVTHRGCQIRESVFNPDNVDEWLRSTDGDVRAVESVVNHVHLYDVALRDDHDLDFAAFEDLGQRIADVWTALLTVRYPDRRMVVTYASEPEEYGPTISLHSGP